MDLIFNKKNITFFEKKFYRENFYAYKIRYVIKRLSGHTELQDSTTRKCIRAGLEITAVTIVIGARVGMAMICLSGAGEILDTSITTPSALAMGTLGAVGTFVSFGFLSTFTQIKLIEILTRSIPADEQELISEVLSPCTRTVIKTISVLLGFSSQIPAGIGAYNSALFAPAAMGIFTFLDGGRPSWSLYNTFSSAIQLRTEPKIGIKAELVAVRKLLVKKIETFRSQFESFEMNGAGDLILFDQDSSKKLMTFVEKILLNKTQMHQEMPLPKSSSWAIEGAILLLVSSMLAEFYKLGEDGADGVIDKKRARITFYRETYQIY